MRLVLQNDVVDEVYGRGFSHLVVTLEHQIDYVRENFVENGVIHLLSANGKNFSPLGVFGVLGSKIVNLTLRNHVLCSVGTTAVHSLVDGILLNLINFVYCIVHLTQILEHLNDYFIQILPKDLLHFRLFVVAECQLSLVFILNLQILVHPFLRGALDDFKKHIYSIEFYLFDVLLDDFVDGHRHQDAQHLFELLNVVV